MQNTKITSGIVLADCADDGGKWVIYCEHFTDNKLVGLSMLQDTNKRRLALWRTQTVVWCSYCDDAEKRQTQ